MQDKTWTLKLTDSETTYTGLSSEQAALAIGRLMYGLPAVEPDELAVKRALKRAPVEGRQLPAAA